MVLKLLILILLIISTDTYADHGKKYDVGGWLNYTATTSEYALESYPQVGIYGSLKTSKDTSISGSWYRDPLYHTGRLVYLNGKYTTTLYDIPTEMSIGLLQSNWGLWSDSLINPATSPLLLQGNSIYTIKYESDIVSRLGINLKFTKDKFTVNAFVGSNYAVDDDEFIKHSFIQDVNINKDFGSLIYGTLEYRPIMGHLFKLNLSHNEISKDIDMGLNTIQVGYKYSKQNWTFSTELYHMTARGKVVINNNELMDDDVRFIDTFTYLSYDFPKFRLYGVLGTTFKDDEMGDYIKYSSLYNSVKNNTRSIPDINKLKLLNENNNKSTSITLGVTYDLYKNTTLRLEGSYMKSKGVERLLNTRDAEIRDKDSSYFGFGITHSF